jgi:hypothetical protein
MVFQPHLEGAVRMRTLRELRRALCDDATKSVVDIMPVSMFSCLASISIMIIHLLMMCHSPWNVRLWYVFQAAPPPVLGRN